MKKFVMGLIVGIAITASATAFADEIESIIGKTVEGQFPVKIDGVTLDKQAAVIDGTSYLPVRAIGEAIGRDVSFDADLGIELKQKEGQRVSGTKYYDGNGNLLDGPPQIINNTPVQTEADKRIGELNQQLFKINLRFVEITTILNPYKYQGKPKDEVYEAAIKENEELRIKSEAIAAEIKELENQQ